MPIPPSGDPFRWSAKARRGEKRAVDRAATTCGGHSTRVGRHGAAIALEIATVGLNAFARLPRTWPSVDLSRRAVGPIALRRPQRPAMTRDEARRMNFWRLPELFGNWKNNLKKSPQNADFG